MMKVAVASDDDKHISYHFGKAKGFSVFLFLDDGTISREYRENIGRNSDECGSCNHGMMIETVKDCRYVISHGMGKRIYDDLVAAGIEPIVTDETEVTIAVEKVFHKGLKNRTDRLH